MLCLCTALAKQTLEEKSGQASLVVLFSANRTLLHPRGRISELARFLMMKRESTRCLVLASLIRIAFIPSYSPVALQHGLSCESALRFQELSRVGWIICSFPVRICFRMRASAASTSSLPRSSISCTWLSPRLKEYGVSRADCWNKTRFMTRM